MRPLLALTLAACAAAPTSEAPDPCSGEAPPSTCLSPTRDADWYVAQSLAYFDTMDADVPDFTWPEYAERVARWEWPPWLLLTGWTRDGIHATDTALRAYPSRVPERDCRFFDTQPFGRCRIVFRYEAHGDRPCPIYEEFTFNDAGETTFIEAWSDVDGLRPTTDDDPWGEGPGVDRLSTRLPGLGRPDGLLQPHEAAMEAAAADDAVIADFVRRTDDWFGTWSEAVANAPADQWERGCGWTDEAP